MLLSGSTKDENLIPLRRGCRGMFLLRRGRPHSIWGHSQRLRRFPPLIPLIRGIFRGVFYAALRRHDENGDHHEQ